MASLLAAARGVASEATRRIAGLAPPLHGDATTYSALIAAFGAGAVIGGIWGTRLSETGVPRMIRASALYAVALVATVFTERVSGWPRFRGGSRARSSLRRWSSS